MTAHKHFLPEGTYSITLEKFMTLVAKGEIRSMKLV